MRIIMVTWIDHFAKVDGVIEMTWIHQVLDRDHSDPLC